MAENKSSLLARALRRAYDEAAGAGETFNTLASGAGAMPLGGLAGLAQVLRGKGLAEAEKAQREVSGAFTYVPQTRTGQRNLESIGKVFEPTDRLAQLPAEFAQDTLKMGPEASGLIGAVGALALDPTNLLPELKGAKGAKGAARAAALRKGALLDAARAAEKLSVEDATAAVRESLGHTQKAGKAAAAELATKVAEGQPPEVVAQVRKGLLDKAAGEIGKEVAAKNPVEATYIPWEHVTQEQAAKLADEGAHLRADESGQYVGAPRGFNSMKKVKAQRKAAAEWVMKGLEGVPWYPREREWTQSVAPQGRTKYMADLIGINSPQAQPGPNLQWALGSAWQNAMDKPVEALKNAPKRIQQAAQGVVANLYPELPVGGEKVGAFASRLAEKPKGGMSVNDLWNARLLGYGADWDKGLGPAMHNYSAGETNAVRNLLLNDPKYRARLDALGINPADLDVNAIQAAGWVKGRIDNILKRKKLKALPEDAAKRAAIIEEAAAGFSTYSPRHEMRVEGAGVPVGGKDPLYDALGVPQAPSVAGEARPLVAYQKKKEGLGKLAPAADRGTALVEALRSYGSGEDANAVAQQYKSTTNKGVVKSVPIEVEKKLAPWGETPVGTGEQTARLAEALRAEPLATSALEGGLPSWLEGAKTPARPDVARALEFLKNEGLGGLSKLSKSDAAKLGLPALMLGSGASLYQQSEE